MSGKKKFTPTKIVLQVVAVDDADVEEEDGESLGSTDTWSSEDDSAGSTDSLRDFIVDDIAESKKNIKRKLVRLLDQLFDDERAIRIPGETADGSFSSEDISD